MTQNISLMAIYIGQPKSYLISALFSEKRAKKIMWAALNRNLFLCVRGRGRGFFLCVEISR